MQGHAVRGLLERPALPSRARAIMGKNFHDLPEALRCYPTQLNDRSIRELSTIPATETMLEECRETHILVPGLPFTILEIQRMAPQRTFSTYQYAWYRAEPFATQKRVPTRWYLLRKKPIHDDMGIFGNNHVPSACELVYGIVLHQTITGERLYETACASCEDEDSDGCTVTIQNKVDGLRLNALTPKQHVHMASMRTTLPIVRHMHQAPMVLSLPHVISRI